MSLLPPTFEPGWRIRRYEEEYFIEKADQSSLL
jgi:hypothetical protein